MAPLMRDLFGGSKAWDCNEWTAVDDRVRGGSSQSMMDCASGHARFYGNLDIKTLGGAGFASQRTATDDLKWNLSDYDGLQIEIAKADLQRYTLNLKSELLPKRPDGREQSSITYEYDFVASIEENEEHQLAIRVPWEDFKASYRGREQKDAPPVDTKNIRQLSIMNRSFFGDQEGPFTLTINSISAYTDSQKLVEMSTPYKDNPQVDVSHNEKGVHAVTGKSAKPQGTLSWLGSCCGRR